MNLWVPKTGIRLRTEWLTEARGCGPGWELALTYQGNIEPAPVYTEAMMFLNDDNGAPPPSLKHIRQGALLEGSSTGGRDPRGGTTPRGRFWALQGSPKYPASVASRC